MPILSVNRITEVPLQLMTSQALFLSPYRQRIGYFKSFAIGFKGVRKGGVGVKPPLEFAMLQKRHYLCKGVCVCFRTLFPCLMST